MKTDAALWRRIPGTYGLYKINREGTIRCIDKKPVKIIDIDGYQYLYIPERESIAVHVAMARAFLGLKIGDPRIVHHKDTDRGNNFLHNLEVVSRARHQTLHKELRSRNPQQ